MRTDYGTDYGLAIALELNYPTGDGHNARVGIGSSVAMGIIRSSANSETLRLRGRGPAQPARVSANVGLTEFRMSNKLALGSVLLFLALGLLVWAWAKRPGSGYVWTIDCVRFDTTGWQLREASATTMTWTNPDSDILSLSRVQGQADVSSAVDLPSLRARGRQLAAGNNGGLVYADFAGCAGVRAVSLIYKREQLPAYEYTGMVIIPRDAHHFVVTVASVERGTTGMRDAIVTSQLLQQGRLDPTKTDANHRIEGWFSDPYDSKYDATALNSIADGEQYDSVVPSHPLSKVRGTLRTIEKSFLFQQ